MQAPDTSQNETVQMPVMISQALRDTIDTMASVETSDGITRSSMVRILLMEAINARKGTEV